MIQDLLSFSRTPLAERLLSIAKLVSRSEPPEPALAGPWRVAESECRLPGSHALPQPFKEGLRALRLILESAGLRVTMEIDAAGIIRRELGLDLEPYKILFVCTPLSLLEAIVIGPAAAAYIPAHLIVTGRDDSTFVHLQALPQCELPSEARDPIWKLHSRIARALEEACGRRRL